MTTEVLLTLATIASSIVGIVITGLFSIFVAKIQRSPQSETIALPKILLPNGVQVNKPQKAHLNISVWLIVIPLAFTIAGYLIGLNIKQSQPILPDRSSGTVVSLTYTLLAFGIVGIAAFVFSVIKQRQVGQKAYSAIGISTFTLLLLAVASYYVIAQFLEQRTVYILFDISTNYDGLYEGIVSQLDIAASEIPENVDVALGVFGGSPLESVNCGDARELVAPSNKDAIFKNFVPARKLLLEAQPQGSAGIENAIEYALSKLSGRKGVQQIIIITSRIDDACGMPSKDFIKSVAGDKGIHAEIFIISVGEVEKEEESELRKISDKYEHVGTPNELSVIMRDIFSVPPSLYPSSK